MLTFLFRPKPITIPEPAAQQTVLAHTAPDPLPEDLAYWRAEDELARLAALARQG